MYLNIFQQMSAQHSLTYQVRKISETQNCSILGGGLRRHAYAKPPSLQILWLFDVSDVLNGSSLWNYETAFKMRVCCLLSTQVRERADHGG